MKGKDSINQRELDEEKADRKNFLKLGMLAGTFTLILFSPFLSGVVAKDVYPAGKITFIVPMKPGGGNDMLARLISPYITKYLKQVSPGAKGGDIVIKNEPAAAGRRGYSMVFNAKTDGYTIGLMQSAVVTDSIVEESEFDYTKLSLLWLANSTTKMVVTRKNGFSSWDEVVNAMKKGPVKISTSSFGRGNHVGAIILNEKMKTNFKILPFPGTAESINALIRGDVPLALLTENVAVGLIEAGEIRVLLNSSKLASYPGSVTIQQLGYPELTELMCEQNYVMAPPGLAEEPKNLLIEAMKRTANDKEYLDSANRTKIGVERIYGKDAYKFFLQFIKFYDDIAPMLKKHLKG